MGPTIKFLEQQEIDEIPPVQRLQKYASFISLVNEIEKTVDVVYPGVRIEKKYAYQPKNLPFGVTEATTPVFSFLYFYI